jgi:hypothetical protein
MWNMPCCLRVSECNKSLHIGTPGCPARHAEPGTPSRIRTCDPRFFPLTFRSHWTVQVDAGWRKLHVPPRCENPRVTDMPTGWLHVGPVTILDGMSHPD